MIRSGNVIADNRAKLQSHAKGHTTTATQHQQHADSENAPTKSRNEMRAGASHISAAQVYNLQQNTRTLSNRKICHSNRAARYQGKHSGHSEYIFNLYLLEKNR